MKKKVLAHLCDLLFAVTFSVFLIYFFSDALGVINLPRDAGDNLLKVVLIFLPLTLVVTTIGAWSLEHRRLLIYLFLCAAANLTMGGIVLIVAGSGI